MCYNAVASLKIANDFVKNPMFLPIFTYFDTSFACMSSLEYYSNDVEDKINALNLKISTKIFLMLVRQ